MIEGLDALLRFTLIPCPMRSTSVLVFLPSVRLVVGIRPTGQPLPPRAACAAPAGGSSRAPRHSHDFVSDRVTSTDGLSRACAFILVAHLHSLMGRALDRRSSPAAPGPAPAASAPQRHAPSRAPAEPQYAGRKTPEHRLRPCLQTSPPRE